MLLGRSARAIFDLLEDGDPQPRVHERPVRRAVRPLSRGGRPCRPHPRGGGRRATGSPASCTRRCIARSRRRCRASICSALARALDDVADAVEEAATELELVGVQSVPERARAQARVVLHAASASRTRSSVCATGRTSRARSPTSTRSRTRAIRSCGMRSRGCSRRARSRSRSCARRPCTIGSSRRSTRPRPPAPRSRRIAVTTR